MKADAADEAFARAGELNPRLDLTVVAQASDAANPADPNKFLDIQLVCIALSAHPLDV